MFSSGFPTTNINLKDNSGASTGVLFSTPSEGLHVPFAFIMAERGIPGAIYFGGGNELTKVFGQTTFTPGSPYFNSATRFAGIGMSGGGTELMRLVDDDAQTADLGLFISTTAGDVIQYQKDSSGTRLIDVDGNYIPKLAVDGVTVLKEPGLVVKWFVRPLGNNEFYETLTKTTAVISNKTVTTYPVMGLQVTSPGKYGDRQGFKLYSSTQNDTSIARAIESALYRFVPMELPTEVSTTASAIPDLFNSNYNDVSFKPNAIYAPNNINYGFEYALSNNYVNLDTGENQLPYNTKVYGANIGLIGAAIVALSPELVGVDPYMIDLVTAADVDGNLYDHIQLDEASSTVVNQAVVNYAVGGTDGDTSWTKFQELVANWLAGNDHGEFGNLQQHPMTHFYDPGFSMSTKTLLFTMLGLRDNFKIDVSTQDIALPPNTKAEDIANGQALLFRAQMYPESVINGVGCMRVGIYAHAAELVSNSPYGGLVPFTLNRLRQRSRLDSGTYIKGSSGGMPNSEVTIFRKPNWVADDAVSQALSWETCINTVRHATRVKIFYPALRTVYPNDTSLLVDDEVSDRIIYMYKICREIYARYAGTRNAPKKLYPLIQRDINNECAAAFSGDNINVQATVGQTAYDANLGYQISVNLAVTGSLSLRVMNFDVVVGRATGDEQ